MQKETETRIERLEKSGRRWRWAATALACVVMLGAGMAMQDGLDEIDAPRGHANTEASAGVADASGFAVFVRSDGNLVIVHGDGSIIRTSNQPMAVGF